MYAWRKKQRIKLLNTIAVVVATVNPEKAQKALNGLIEEMFPEVEADRQKSVDRALDIMEKERKKVFSVSPLHKRKPQGLVKKINKVLQRGNN
jgi:glutamate synthase domain-containing protein 3